MASDVCETATHCSYGPFELPFGNANCVRIHRFAIGSHWATGSPLFVVWQAPPMPDQIVFIPAGPYSSVPVFE